MARVTLEDGTEGTRYHLTVVLTDDERTLLRRAAKEAGLKFYDMLYVCFAEGLEAQGQAMEQSELLYDGFVTY